MTTDNLGEFLSERVLATRMMHQVDYPIDAEGPAVAVSIGCAQDGSMIVILPVVARGLIHLEIHSFMDGERTDPDVTIPIPPEGVTEVTLRRTEHPS